MTTAARLGMIAVGVLLAALLVAAHCLMPIDRSWQYNRVLHYVWLGVTSLACVGGVVFLLWPRAKLPRRDQERKRARDRIISMIVVVVGTFALVAFGEVRRDRITHAYLAPALDDMAAIKDALVAYRADHQGVLPPKLTDLVPKYLAVERLYYKFRKGPVAAPAPQEIDAEGDEPSYLLMTKLSGGAAEKGEGSENPILIFQRPGEGWAPLVAALGVRGKTGLIGEEDATRSLGTQKPRRR